MSRSRSFASKSMMSGMMIGYETKSMVNTITVNYTNMIGGGASTEFFGIDASGVSITYDELEALTSIHSLYTSQLADKSYQNIPVDFSQYLKLRNIANDSVLKYKRNEALSMLFQITVDAITGAINAYSLNTANTETKIQNLYLQKTLEEIINGVNVKKAFDENSGTLSMQQSFQLAPLFRYYIRLYGLPSPGIGFDPVKLALILTAMENSGIDPYN
jgi:hypothetical protein